MRKWIACAAFVGLLCVGVQPPAEGGIADWIKIKCSVKYSVYLPGSSSKRSLSEKSIGHFYVKKLRTGTSNGKPVYTKVWKFRTWRAKTLGFSLPTKDGKLNTSAALRKCKHLSLNHGHALNMMILRSRKRQVPMKDAYCGKNIRVTSASRLTVSGRKLAGTSIANLSRSFRYDKLYWFKCRAGKVDRTRSYTTMP